jgi:uncharacterized membrane protein YjjP (DUF1212 family)
MNSLATHRDFLARAGQLLLEYNASSEEVIESLRTTARSLSSDKFDVAVSYTGVVISFGEGGPEFRPVKEFRYNQSLHAKIHAILRGVRRGELAADIALEQLNGAERDTPSHPQWLVAIALGLAAASLARILGADYGAMLVAGLSSALGLFARKELGRRHLSLLVLPLSAAFIGAALAGIAFRRGWTNTPGLAVIVPSLMLVPGPHLLNGLFDLIDNHVPMSLARLALATGILFASSAGIVLGLELTLAEIPSAGQPAAAGHLNLSLDMFLAGLVTSGFALFYNATWQQTFLAAIGGMAGHGTRFLALQNGVRTEMATLFGALIVGVVAAVIARHYKTPVAVIAFAGAVTMMPGVQIYRAFGGAIQIARLRSEIAPERVSAMLGDAFQSTLIVSALAIGLIVAARIVSAFPGLTLIPRGRDNE